MYFFPAICVSGCEQHLRVYTYNPQDLTPNTSNQNRGLLISKIMFNHRLIPKIIKLIIHFSWFMINYLLHLLYFVYQ